MYVPFFVSALFFPFFFLFLSLNLGVNRLGVNPSFYVKIKVLVLMVLRQNLKT